MIIGEEISSASLCHKNVALREFPNYIFFGASLDWKTSLQFDDLCKLKRHICWFNQLSEMEEKLKVVKGHPQQHKLIKKNGKYFNYFMVAVTFSPPSDNGQNAIYIVSKIFRCHRGHHRSHHNVPHEVAGAESSIENVVSQGVPLGRMG